MTFYQKFHVSFIILMTYQNVHILGNNQACKAQFPSDLSSASIQHWNKGNNYNTFTTFAFIDLDMKIFIS